MTVKINGSGRDPSLWTKLWPFLLAATVIAFSIYGCEYAMAGRKPGPMGPQPDIRCNSCDQWVKRPPPPNDNVCPMCGGPIRAPKYRR